MYIGVIDQTWGITGYPDTTSPYYYSVASSASADTKGSYTGTTSFPHDAALIVQFIGESAQQRDWLVDVAIGGLGSEIVIVENIYVNCVSSAAYRAHKTLLLPIRIPAGETVRLRQQTDTPTNSLYFGLSFIPVDDFQATRPYDACVTFGADTSNSRGTVIDAGGTTHTKGSYAEIVSAANNTQDTKGFMLSIGNGYPTMSSGTEHFHFDLAIGASGSEINIIEDFHVARYNSGDTTFPPFTPFFPIAIPAGTRISARCASTSNSATTRFFAMCFHGFY